jgi:predicted patatin/cPLA2 family phospholipase
MSQVRVDHPQSASGKASAETTDPNSPCRILSLDGGGAKGFYTLGVLKQLEALLGGEPLSSRFDLIFGTSTGAIIAALLALGRSVEDIYDLYEEHVPNLMSVRGCARRSRALEKLAQDVFQDQKFDTFKTGIGIVTARWREERPMIFKASIAQAHGSHSTFKPGFGCTIADAVVASCSAYPIFKRKILTTADGHEVELLDGGYCANNPTLYAIADAVMALKLDKAALRVVSIGVGVYPEPARYAHKWLIHQFFLVRLLQKTLDINTHSMETLAGLLFKDVQLERINDTYSTPEMATDLMEHDLRKLRLLYQRGWESFAKHENNLEKLLQVE